MLRNVLDDYLDSVSERHFDYPLTSLFHAMGFYDIHFTHGSREIGKDFIAKKLINGIEHQYAIQSKKGDINQSKFTSEVYPQLLLASISGLSHPQFDKNIPRRVVLVTTGRLVGNTPLILQELNNDLEMNYAKERVEFWGKEQLIPLFEEYGLSSIHQLTSQGLSGYAYFFQTYSKAVDGTLSEREMENYSRLWLDESLADRKRILRAAIEAEIIATRLIERERVYEALTVYLSLARVVMQVLYENDDAYLARLYQEIIEEKILHVCKGFFHQIKIDWEEAGKSLLHLCLRDSSFPMLHYLVWCARTLETISLYFFVTKDLSEQDEAIAFLIDFIEKEQGCGHISSDRYAVSLVWTTLALIQASRTETALDLVKRSAIWLCDRVEKGFGLAGYEADEFEETAVLLGYAFECIKVEKNSSSYLATVLGDLAAFIGDKKFYGDVVNDLDACDIAYSYWQFPDTKAIFTIDTEECRTYPNIPHQYSIDNFEDFNYAEHIKHEPNSFQITERVGASGLVLLSVLLKDRYFPKLWKQIISENQSSNNNQIGATGNSA
jgi:hypothetical protein